MKKYLLLIWLFLRILFSLHKKEYKNFGLRPMGGQKGSKMLKKPLHNRWVQNQKGKTNMSQKDVFLYFSLEAFSEEESSFREDLFVPFMLLCCIYTHEERNINENKS